MGASSEKLIEVHNCMQSTYLISTFDIPLLTLKMPILIGRFLSFLGYLLVPRHLQHPDPHASEGMNASWAYPEWCKCRMWRYPLQFWQNKLAFQQQFWKMGFSPFWIFLRRASMVSWWFRLGRGRIYPLGCCCIFQRTWPQKSVWLPRIQQNNTYPIWKSHWIFWNTPHVFRTSLKSTSLCQVQHSTKILYEWLFVLLDPTPANLASFLPSQQHPERQAPKHTTFHWYIQKHNKKNTSYTLQARLFKC